MLSKTERLLFANQLEILEKLDPANAAAHAVRRTALEDGYELDYMDIFRNIYDGLDLNECKEVRQILNMFDAIDVSLKALPSGDSLQTHHRRKFVGFDGNNEVERMAYVKFIVDELKQYTWMFASGFNYNSHRPTLPTYQAMLGRWNALGGKNTLNRNELATILA